MTVIREISHSEKDYWDEGIQHLELVHPLNAYAWGQVRSVDRWHPIYLVAEREGKFCGACLILEKRIPYTPFSLLYSPKGPVWDYRDDETLCAIIDKIKEIAGKRKAIFLRIDPNIPESLSMNVEDRMSSLGFVHLQQRWTVWNSPRDLSRIDLTKAATEEELFNTFDREARRNIRKAAREGVVIEVAVSEAELQEFYTIFKEFSVKKGFMSRDYEYQKSLWDNYIANGMGRLFLAKYEGKIIGGLICIMFGRKCLAMHMGTSRQYQKLSSYYAYVWESIKWAREKGCTWYSFRGVGTTPTQEYFKRKFSPTVVSLVGYYDLPLRPFLYNLFYFCEFTLLPRALPLLVNARKLYNKIIKAKEEVN